MNIYFIFLYSYDGAECSTRERHKIIVDDSPATRSVNMVNLIWLIQFLSKYGFNALVNKVSYKKILYDFSNNYKISVRFR
jgi:hypothetical protein